MSILSRGGFTRCWYVTLHLHHFGAIFIALTMLLPSPLCQTALKFLNEDCSLVHGAIAIPSVYVDPAGEWKLFGFECLCSLSEDSPLLMVSFPRSTFLLSKRILLLLSALTYLLLIDPLFHVFEPPEVQAPRSPQVPQLGS